MNTAVISLILWTDIISVWSHYCVNVCGLRPIRSAYLYQTLSTSNLLQPVTALTVVTGLHLTVIDCPNVRWPIVKAVWVSVIAIINVQVGI